MNTRWLLMMSKWSRHPPSAKQVKFVLIILAICITLAIINKTVGWPEALTVNRLRP